MENCEDGVCSPAPLDGGDIKKNNSDKQVIYVGDPMCSWCWGISEHLKDLRQYLKSEGIGYDIIMGGLRPGGGDEWNQQMKDFLQHHWHEVNSRSGQAFGTKLFELSEFDYDTEPSCRAVVTAKHFLDIGGVSSFFEEVQRKFYVENEDPKQVDFYQEICQKLGIDFGYFKRLFESTETAKATRDEFVMNRQWGVSGYPTVLLKDQQELHLIAHGYAEFETMKSNIQKVMTF